MIKKAFISIIMIVSVFMNTEGFNQVYSEGLDNVIEWNATTNPGGEGTCITGQYQGESESTIYYNPNSKRLLPGDIYWFELSDSVTDKEFPTTIEVEYYDAQPGKFLAEYQVFSFDSNIVRTEKTEEVICTGSNEWKTYTFELKKPLFQGAFSYKKNWVSYSADFNITNCGESGNVYLGKVKVNKSEYPIVMEFRNNAVSNVYNLSNQCLTVNFENYTANTVNAEITARIYQRDWKSETMANQPIWNKNEVWKKHENITLGKDGQKTIEYMPNLSEFGIYKLEITAKSGDFERSESIEFSVVNSAEGIKNARMNINQEFGRHGEDDFDDKLSLCEQAGFGSFRIGNYWNLTEKEKGKRVMPESKTSPENMSKLDFTATHSLGYGNSLYNEEAKGENLATFPHGKEATDAFVEYVRFVVREYATKAPGKVKYYSLWNEFNLSGFNKGGASNKEYAEMLKRIYPVIKEEDSNAEVIAMVACADDTHYDFIKEVLSYGTYNYFDAISYHPYCFLGSDRHIEKSTALRELLEEYRPEGAPKKELYYTECGYPTSIISEKGQADYAVKLYAESLGKNLASKLWWYDLMDKNAEDKDVEVDHEPHFGLLQNPKFGGYAKFSYISMCGLNKFMYDAVFNKELSENDDVSAYEFKKGKFEKIAVVWSNKKNQTKTAQLDLGTETAEVYDVFTNHKEQLKSNNGIYNIEVTDSPIYIRYSTSGKSEDKSLKLSIDGDTTVKSNEMPKYIYTITNTKGGNSVNGTLKAYSENDKENILYEKDVIISANTEVSCPIEIKNPGSGSHNVIFELNVSRESGDETLYSLNGLEVIRIQHGDFYTVSIDEGVLNLKIQSEPNVKTAVKVTDSDGNTVFLGQGESDAVGKSNISGFLPYSGMFNITVHTGEIALEDILSSDGIKMTYELKRRNVQTGNTEVINAQDINDDDDIILSVTYFDYNGGKKTNIYSALYNEDKTLNNVDVKNIGLNGKADFEIHIDKADKINSWKIYAWDENLNPLETSKLIFQR